MHMTLVVLDGPMMDWHRATPLRPRGADTGSGRMLASFRVSGSTIFFYVALAIFCLAGPVAVVCATDAIYPPTRSGPLLYSWPTVAALAGCAVLLFFVPRFFQIASPGLTIETVDGNAFDVPEELVETRLIFRAVASSTAPHLLPRLAKAVLSGERTRFGRFDLSRDEIEMVGTGERLPWSDVRGFGVHWLTGRFGIARKGSWAWWLNVSTAAVPNLHLAVVLASALLSPNSKELLGSLANGDPVPDAIGGMLAGSL